ncbi:transcriptional regulator Ngg1 [Pseudozyma hubeiensis SY62]|uniref:Transcriptional regulator Ngg1 n=1 Tax=Pseudozyma hubeiensis (strain SY62) TaxID=1305764 RepID=R9P852_PSEHS|nr:transcriptional regulator Ngg1 [Pseudozyma hubeiensis SY62]GAC97546.1 transcriptional regulator Ngg1 [Pseudozyma hubeiensis SY62]
MSRASRDAAAAAGGASSPFGSASASRASTSAPFYRQFLPAQLSNISPNDSIPSLDELSALAKHLGRIKTESAARLSRLDSRSSDPTRPIFYSAPNDLFSPPGLSSLSTAALNLHSDSARQSTPSTSSSKNPKTRERSFASPAPSSSTSNLNGSAAGALASKNKVKVKRERDNDSAPASSSALYSGSHSPNKLAGAAGKANPRSKAARAHSFDVGADDESIASTDPEWDFDEDSMPSRPGRTYAKNKKRKRRDAGADSNDDESGSEFEAGALLGAAATNKHITSSSAAAPRSAAAATSAAGTSSGGTATPKIPAIGMRLKANAGTGSAAAAAQTPPGFPRKASDGTQVSTRRNSVLPSPSPLPSTPLAQPPHVPPVIYQPAPGWELPARTPATFMPALEKSRKPRAYPTKPGEVMEDFANKDWKEKERERDRLLERESVGPGTPGGIGPGQSMVKEATAGRRGGRDLQQTPINTFYNYADAFFKTLTEDDLAWLSSKSDDHEPFQMPPLGRHYKEVWEEEEALMANGSLDVFGNSLGVISRSPSISMGAGGGLPLDVSALAVARNGTTDDSNKHAARAELEIPPPPPFRVKQMSNQHLGLESPLVVDARSGPLAERLVASLLPSHTEDAADNTTASSAGHQAGSAIPPALLANLNGHSSRPDDEDGDDEDADGEADLDFEGVVQDQDMATFEERIAKELKALEVLGADENLDWSTRADDEISTTLRMVQRELARQQKVNEMRKDRLFGIAKDRMAYQDYLNCLNSVEKEIEIGWTKRLRQIRASLSKRKKGGHSYHDDSNLSQGLAANGVSSASGTPQPGAAPYHGPVRPQLSENMVGAMDRREKLQYAFKELFDEARHAWQTPTESVYADLDLDKVE